MDWDAISTGAEVVGAIGVIASLLFLAFETRKNTSTMRASLSNEVLTATAELNDVILADPEIRRVTSKATDPCRTVEDFTPEEKDIVIYLARALFMRYEGVYMLYKQGLVEPSVWAGRCELAAGLIQLPIWAEYWEKDQDRGLFTPEFAEAVNNAKPVNFDRPLSAGDT